MFFKRKCKHHLINVCIWHVDTGDMGAEAWDGAYTDFCTKCQQFAAEISYGRDSPDGTPYIDGGAFIFDHGGNDRIVPTRALTKWTPAKKFRGLFRN